MRVKLAVFSLLSLALACGCHSEPGGEAEPASTSETPAAAPEETGRTAVAAVAGKSGSGLSGQASFTEMGGGVHMRLVVGGAPPGEHAVHLHEIGDCSADDGSSAGGHWNPTGEDHGRWGEGSHHRGDIGNLLVGEDGAGEIELHSNVWTLGGAGDSDVVGRALIVHAAADDFASQPTGNAGGRIGCGVIELPEDLTEDTE